MKNKTQVLVEENLKKAFQLAMVRSPYKSIGDWAEPLIIKFCLEYAPNDLKELTGITEETKL